MKVFVPELIRILLGEHSLQGISVYMLSLYCKFHYAKSSVEMRQDNIILLPQIKVYNNYYKKNIFTFMLYINYMDNI